MVILLIRVGTGSSKKLKGAGKKSSKGGLIFLIIVIRELMLLIVIVPQFECLFSLEEFITLILLVQRFLVFFLLGQEDLHHELVVRIITVTACNSGNVTGAGLFL